MRRRESQRLKTGIEGLLHAFHRARESLAVVSDHLPALLLRLLVALSIRLEDRRLEFGADFLRSLAQDVFESVPLTALLQASREDLLDRLQPAR